MRLIWTKLFSIPRQKSNHTLKEEVQPEDVRGCSRSLIDLSHLSLKEQEIMKVLTRKIKEKYIYSRLIIMNDNIFELNTHPGEGSTSQLST